MFVVYSDGDIVFTDCCQIVGNGVQTVCSINDAPGWLVVVDKIDGGKGNIDWLTTTAGGGKVSVRRDGTKPQKSSFASDVRLSLKKIFINLSG